MTKTILLSIIALTLFAAGDLHAQDLNPTPHATVALYGGPLHQHHNFYAEPFSYTGIEAGAILSHHYVLGLYGSSFLSTLQVRTAANPLDLFLCQGGVVLGAMTADTNVLHAGVLLNAGYIAINATDSPLLPGQASEIDLQGLVLVPQVFGEINMTKWLRLRTGIGFDIYGVEYQPPVARSDLQSVSFNFGFIFGDFQASRSVF